MPWTRMWRIFSVAIGFGMTIGVILYIVLHIVGGDVLMRPHIGIPMAGGAGLLLGFSYYVFFKLTLRAFTTPFLEKAQALVTRPIAPLRPVWVSNEIDKLGEILTEALATLERLDKFSGIAKEIVATLDPQVTLGRILSTAVETLPADSGLVFLLDEKSQRYAVRAFHQLPLPDELVDRISFATQEGVPGWVATEGQALVISNAQEDERVHPTIQRAGVQSLMSAPLVFGSRPLGVLNLFNTDQRDAFDENDMRLAYIYADLAAVALNNARLFAQATTEHTKLAAVLSDTTDVVIVLDQAGQTLLLNHAAEQCLQVQGSRVIGQPISALGVDELVTALEEAQTSDVPLVHEIAAPSGRTLYTSVSPVHDVGWVMVMQDITHLKELDRLRTEWVATVSHDLKNPITAIQLSADLMEKAGPLTEMQRSLLARMQSGGLRLESLVTDVLDLARLEVGPSIQAVAVSLADVIASALDEIEPLAATKGHVLISDVPLDLPAARGDAALLVRVLVNLLSNAVKYTPDGGRVVLRVRSKNGLLWVEVADSGLGIPAEALPHIFDRFYRVPGSEQEAEGTGLGLSVVQTIVEKHGGEVRVESEPGQGSTFTFSVPAVGGG